ncbi:hypothetical protein D0812_01530 [Vibrio owensii]|uniref:Uncharacterized protein n=1 Tax=Vibrio owensii TaxID=696485 RepID=A0AAP9G999_9VIBR|nr:hypothetical protein D0812_01530 [Vibrio owensii]RCR60891.1 hypothetical protein DTW68_19750 [Vibrio harveyi]AYO21643.1 hypothetical protein D0856_17275 [Vibrio owensii]NOI73388.1 hypothetical protein [Vibrio owensii]QGH45873.1 hypothetical protein APZ19_01510 [Vibrio owensii]
MRSARFLVVDLAMNSRGIGGKSRSLSFNCIMLYKKV